LARVLAGRAVILTSVVDYSPAETIFARGPSATVGALGVWCLRTRRLIRGAV